MADSSVFETPRGQQYLAELAEMRARHARERHQLVDSQMDQQLNFAVRFMREVLGGAVYGGGEGDRAGAGDGD